MSGEKRLNVSSIANRYQMSLGFFPFGHFYLPVCGTANRSK
jgi:hypothetical protein